ncbi:non-structural maintenance of chromosomes element 1 homolog [Episyrphus balteatus]|uniref:non-structural maintenance of chromosomes element 1 homolog n=1 Tax=Episyrphus balteatus TaxID=286459 RepID=UPI0024868936|nr:non-structural maintenance of chromosomes element 1 homolog [Episyrphus balteatus]
MEEVKQHFVQVCASYGSLTKADATEILRPICAKYEVRLPEDSHFKKFIKDINEELNRYDHDIAFVKYPISKEEFLVFRTMNSKVIRFLNNLSEQDRNYFRLLLTTIASSDEYGIPDIRAINLSTMLPDKPLAKNRAEDLLQNWKHVGYFYQSDNTLFFGPRMMVEFESLLLSSFPDDVKECSLCKTIVLWDPSCNECETKFHSECIRKYLIKKSNCPACQKVWNTSFA